jgi:hypothetical protein
MAQLIGIRQHSIQKIISGARVAFDPRTTEQVCTTRDPENYRTKEKAIRTRQWQERENEKRNQRAS